MERLRHHRASGDIVAESSDGEKYVSVLDRSPFARRAGEVFQFTDGRIGRLSGTVIFIKDEKQDDQPTFWYEVDHPEELLQRWLSEQRIGGHQPVSVSVSKSSDAEDRQAWFFEITLPNPSSGAETWSPSDLELLQRGARDKALEVGLDWPWFFRFKPESDEAPEEPVEVNEQDGP